MEASAVYPCAFCGRDNDASARFCIDCGKPIGTLSAPTPSAAVPPAISCAWCGNAVDASLPFCAYCGRRTGHDESAAACAGCGGTVRRGVDLFCATCGAAQSGGQQATRVLSAGLRDLGARIALLDERGEPKRVIALEKPDTTIGRGECDVRIGDDVYLSPVHAMLAWRDGGLVVRDLGSRNRTWIFLTGATKLADDDVVMVGSQLLRYRRLDYPGAHPPDADGTRGIGSLTPTPDVAVLEQLRADGSVRDALHLALGRRVVIGRESGDWLFPYDQTMSSRHAEVREEGGDFIVADAGSRNGVALAVRGERALRTGDRVLCGDQLFRVERA